MKPRLNTSSRSPRIDTTSSPVSVIASPQVASHSGHVRNAVRMPVIAAGEVTVSPATGNYLRSKGASMGSRRRELFADWLIVFGGLGLLISLFLTWSHQFSPAFLAQFGSAPQLRGIPHDPNAWQLYSVADVRVALLAVGLIGV